MGRGDGEKRRWGDEKMGRTGDGEKGEMGRRGDGERREWGEEKIGRGGNGEKRKWGEQEMAKHGLKGGAVGSAFCIQAIQVFVHFSVDAAQ